MSGVLDRDPVHDLEIRLRLAEEARATAESRLGVARDQIDALTADGTDELRMQAAAAAFRAELADARRDAANASEALADARARIDDLDIINARIVAQSDIWRDGVFCLRDERNELMHRLYAAEARAQQQQAIIRELLAERKALESRS